MQLGESKSTAFLRCPEDCYKLIQLSNVINGFKVVVLWRKALRCVCCVRYVTLSIHARTTFACPCIVFDGVKRKSLPLAATTVTACSQSYCVSVRGSNERMRWLKEVLYHLKKMYQCSGDQKG